jgi:hypothetical protein
MAVVYEIHIGDIEQRDSAVTILKQFGGVVLIDGDSTDHWHSLHVTNSNAVVGGGKGVWTRSSSRKTIDLVDENGTVSQGYFAYESWPIKRRDIGKIFLKKPMQGARGEGAGRVVFDYLVWDVA